MSNKPIHLIRRSARRSACGTLLSTHASNIADEVGVFEVEGVHASHEWQHITCRRCVTTLQYHQAKELRPAMTTETVGEPTQTRPTAEPLVGALLGESESNTFDNHTPLIHAMTKRGNPLPLCTNNDEAKWTEGYSTMDGGAVTCRYCLQDPLFIQRNNMFTEMMSPSHGEGEAEPAAIVHDREMMEDYGQPWFEHDCEACKFLGKSKGGHDLYWCSQGGGTNISTVIARHGSDGPEYISGLGHARDNEALALAVVRAFHAGLLNDTDLSWL